MSTKALKTINLRVTTGSRQVGVIDGAPFFQAEVEDMKYSMSGIKRYHNALMVLAGVGGVARDLMDWLTTKMDNDNIIYSNSHTRASFIKFVKDSMLQNNSKVAFAYKVPSDRTIKNAFFVLIDRNMLVYKDRGVYIVNPMYFMSNRNEGSREKLITMVLEFKYGKNTVIRIDK